MPVNHAGMLVSGVVALVLSLLAPLGGAIVGEWSGRDEDGQEERITLRADGKGTLADTKIEWRVSGDSLLVRFEGIPIEARYSFRVEGDQMWLRDDEGESRQYRRTSGGSEGGAGPGSGGGAPSSGGSSGGAAPAGGGTTAAGRGQVFTSPRGFEMELPPGWRAVPADGGAAALAPPDFRQGLEVYGVESRPVGASSLTSEEVLAFFDAQARQASPLLARKGGPESLGGGAIRLAYEGTTPQGTPLKALVLARMLAKDGVYIAGAAEPARLDAFAPLLRKAFDSIRASAAPTGGAAGGTAAGPGATGPFDDASWLVGLWAIKVRAGDLTNETTDARFGADGSCSYTWTRLTSQVGGGVAFYNEIYRAGTYRLSGGVLTMTFDPSRSRWQYPPSEGSTHAQPQWQFPAQRGIDPKTGREAIISNGEVVVVREK